MQVKRQTKSSQVLWVIIGLSFAVHIASLILGKTIMSSFEWEHHPVHAAVEMSGSVIALLVAWLLISLDRRGEGTTYNAWISGALVGMGVLDGIHALVHAGNEFVWLHSTATFVGGVLFSMVWLSPNRRTADVVAWPLMVLVGSLAFGILSLLFPQFAPTMVQAGQFTLSAKALNVLGGVLLLFAALRLVLTWRETRNNDDLLFCLHCSLFGAAAIMFEQSKLWDLPWWGWHLLRLMAYLVALWFVVLSDLRVQSKMAHLADELQSLNETLEERVRLRTAEVDEREKRLKAIVDTANDAIITIDEHGLVASFNHAAEMMFGFSADEIIGHNISRLMPEPHKSMHDEYLAEYRRTGVNKVIGLGREVDACRRDGSIFPVELSVSEMQLADGTMYAGIVRDITERKRSAAELSSRNQQLAEKAAQLEEQRKTAVALAEELQEADRAKSEFLANMSHEIRTPMNAVLGLTELVLQSDLDSMQRDYLSTVMDSADGLLSIINDILDFSKIEAGIVDVEQVQLKVHDTVADTVRSQALRAQRRNLELACFVDPTIPEVLTGDPGRLRQVLINLVGNAIKFTEDGEVVIRVLKESEDSNSLLLKFLVQDTGIGIPADKLGTIFEAFEQADMSTTRKYGGTGLGLTICRKLVALMDGDIGVESEVGKGSTFWFTARFAPSESAEEPKTIPEALRDVRILIVDDNETNRTILEQIVLAKGMQPTTAATALEAFNFLQEACDEERPFQLLISDVHMPEIDGFGLSEMIRNDTKFDDLEIVFLTSAGQQGDQARCENLRITTQLMKPIKQSELYNVVLRTLNLAGTQDQGWLVLDDSEESDLPPLRILLVEDSVANQKLALAVLSGASHRIVVANDGSEALATLEEQNFDVVLMDVQMPVMDGLEATRTIRSREEGTDRHQPIVAMTAHAMSGDRERCLAAGMDEYVSKPVQQEALFKAIAIAMGFRYMDTPSSGILKKETGGKSVDWTGPLRQLRGDHSVLKEITESYIEETLENLALLPALISDGNHSEVLRRAHIVKGAMRFFGAKGAQDCGQALEDRAATGELNGADVLFERMKRAVEKILPALRRFVETGEM